MSNDLSNLVFLFKKLASFDPFQNLNEDINDALQHAAYYVTIKSPFVPFKPIPLEWFNIEKFNSFPIEKLKNYDDFSSWIETMPGELKNHYSEQELHKYLINLRGSHALSWLEGEISAVIVVDLPKYTCIGDGRGRLNFAIGMGLTELPVVILKLKKKYRNQIRY